MSKTDKLLRDPRSHRAVPLRDRVELVQESTLRKWHEEQVPARSAVRRRRFGRVAVRRAVTWASTGCVALVAAALMRGGILPSLDRSVGYHLGQLYAPIESGIVLQPVSTALGLTVIAGLLGFLLLPRASRSALSLSLKIWP